MAQEVKYMTSKPSEDMSHKEILHKLVEDFMFEAYEYTPISSKKELVDAFAKYAIGNIQ